MSRPCFDCDVDGHCTMNCGPARETRRAERAVDALRRPDPTLAKVPGTVRDAIAEVIENQQHALRCHADLLESLEKIDHTLTVHGHIDAGTALHATLRAAIAKATGSEG